MKKRLVILGAGETGTGSAILGLKEGYDVFLSDRNAIKEKYITELDEYKVVYEQNKHTEELILNADLVIKSPGIPDTSDIIVKIKSKNIPIVSEIEFAGRYTKAYKICITGTDGKTTTTSLIYHILKKAGLNVGLGGNIGESFARQVALKSFDYYVLEISSFQLDDMYEFKADIALITNISPDHLDRYNYDINLYIQSKFRITQNQTENDYFIYCKDSELLVSNLPLNKGKATTYSFSCFEETLPGAYQKEKIFYINTNPKNKPNFMYDQNDMSLRGRHNAYNAMAAGIVADVLDISKSIVRDSFTDFQTIEHRLESVGKVGGIEFINDSKATTVNAAWFALESMETPVIWIAGGQDKGNDYTKLKPLIKDKVRFIICIGNDNRKIHEAFSSDVEMMINATSMQEAVKVSFQLATKGDTVLLSPACASFDRFVDYQERGRIFKKSVKNL
ncbi:MAG: UDP-N-acetylmuramoyl-L-alanine--D-glutamate ligase [Bacteroidetes bacterium]|nr:UDP-N-acetylmuramoyl-L-alanine--D-glutamate ligase [Bacteroidota bacterium]